jgi:hypothetical protein
VSDADVVVELERFPRCKALGDFFGPGLGGKECKGTMREPQASHDGGCCPVGWGGLMHGSGHDGQFILPVTRFSERL